MFKKLVVAAVLIAFVCVQLAASLNCYHCDGPNPCKSPSKVSCSSQNANATNNALRQYFLNVPTDAPSQNFECLHTTYNQSTAKIMEVRGCVFREHSACSLQINATVGSSWSKTNCTTCGGDYCNGNPAGTFSSSSFTIFASVVGLMVTKMFVL